MIYPNVTPTESSMNFRDSTKDLVTKEQNSLNFEVYKDEIDAPNWSLDFGWRSMSAKRTYSHTYWA